MSIVCRLLIFLFGWGGRGTWFGIKFTLAVKRSFIDSGVGGVVD